MRKSENKMRQVRSVPTEFTTRSDEGGNLHITGYFSVFNSVYEIRPGMSESVAPGAFSDTLSSDIRALTNHDSTLVLGRTSAGTLKLQEDSRGLWGDIEINPADSDAMNTYERVKRGDVNQCSIGFQITEETTEVREDGSVHWTIRKVILFEVSVCTFPAYEETNVSARSQEYQDIRKREFDGWKEKLLRRVHRDGD